MTIKDLEDIVYKNLEEKTEEFKRVFHGRGGLFKGFEFLTIDSIDKTLFVVFFNEIDKDLEEKLLTLFGNIYKEFNFEALVLQRRYLTKDVNEVVLGQLPQETFLIENGLKYKLDLSSYQNHGFFGDMRVGHEFIQSIAKDKNVLNLFSYTCAFSVCAIQGGASKVVNVDMSKASLTTGRTNHHLNSQDTKKVQFMPHNILKSWNKIKKAGPYDIIIIDPPSFQKGSFAATKDYEKIIKRLKDFASNNCIVLSCLNDPKLDSSFIIEMFKEYASEFVFEKRLENLNDYKALNEEESLKNLIFRRV